MENKRVVLVTGVADQWGAQVSRQLAQKPGIKVIGLDAVVPEHIPPEIDFIQADVRNPLLNELLRSEKVDTVCHLAFRGSVRRSEANFDHNVMGTMKLFGAAAESGVRKIVHRSSTAVYGAKANNPAFISETHPLQAGRRYGYLRDLAEIEEFCHGFRQQVPDLLITTLRMAPVIGPTIDTPLTRLLSGRLTPMLLGFDPIMQLIFEQDAIDALVTTVEDDYPGVFNVAAGGVMPLTRMLALTSTVPLPILHPLAHWARDTLRGRLNPQRHLPIDLAYLRYRCVADTTRMESDLDFNPQYTAEEALREFAGHKRHPVHEDNGGLAFDADRLRHTLERRQRQRDRLDHAGIAEEG